MDKTYLTVMEGEKRAVEITVRDESDASYIPTSAYYSIVDEDGLPVVSETVCMISTNKIYALLDESVTVLPGKYEIIWKINKVSGITTYIYYHKTIIFVEEI